MVRKRNCNGWPSFPQISVPILEKTFYPNFLNFPLVSVMFFSSVTNSLFRTPQTYPTSGGKYIIFKGGGVNDFIENLHPPVLILETKRKALTCLDIEIVSNISKTLY